MPRSVRFNETGGAEVLQIVDVPIPEPGAGEVRIRVHALGLNRAEVMYRSGAYLQTPTFPAQLGYEAAGVIDAVGPDVGAFTVGDRVAVVPAFSFAEYGLYGELVLAPARAVVKLPDDIPWVDAAATWMAFVTAWGGLVHYARLSAGDVVLIPAASSSVGLAAIQVANMVGATPVALTRSAAKVDALKEAGAKHVVVTSEQGIAAEVLRLTDGGGARVVFDPVGGRTFAELVKATAVGGTLVLYGALSKDETPLPVLEVLGRRLTIRGYVLFEATEDDAALEAAKRFVLDGLRRGLLRPQIAKTFDFDAIVEAHRYLESNAQVGKVVVVVRP
jgi:NADPH:quinone reductase-like Zn-dependent oxidoreductase